MNFQKISKLAGLLSKSFAEDFFRLLVAYKSISASEAASRLDQHIKTAQDFLEGLSSLDIVEKVEVSEGKRPYFRYTLKQQKMSLEIDFTEWYDSTRQIEGAVKRIRERKNAGAMFSTAGNNPWISSVVILTGEGRNQKERRINLTKPQGLFLYHLPFPSAVFMNINEIMAKAGVDNVHTAEILDIVGMLEEFKVIESE